jgi:hypothetical protein
MPLLMRISAEKNSLNLIDASMQKLHLTVGWMVKWTDVLMQKLRWTGGSRLRWTDGSMLRWTDGSMHYYDYNYHSPYYG